MPSPAELTKTERLKFYARPLRPARAPFYVQHPTIDCPLMGWWWQPADARAPEPLAAQYDGCVERLRDLITDQEAHVRAQRDIIELWMVGKAKIVELANVTLTRGSVFQVMASWRGPGDEPQQEDAPDRRSYFADYYDAATLELGRAIALDAVDVLKHGGRVDLREIAAAVKRRHPELQALTRDAEGALVMGDTAPDEAA
jgi:hypothetical protein